MTITKTPVTLTVEETERLLRIIGDVARSDWEHSRRTKSAASRHFSTERANWLRSLECEMVKRLYVQSPQAHCYKVAP